MSSHVTALDKRLIRLAAKVAERMDHTAAALQALASEAPVAEPSAAPDFDYFVEATRRLLEGRRDRDIMAGAGYAVDAEVQGCAPAMIWWVHRGGNIVERSHSVDPEADSFYDYASLRWFKAPKSRRVPTLSGPFIDTWGSDDYTVTVSVPVIFDGTSCGVLAIDVDVRRFIDTLAADLRKIAAPVALVNEADRVIVSTSHSLSTGLPINPRHRRNHPAEEMTRHPVADYGWSVVLLPD